MLAQTADLGLRNTRDLPFYVHEVRPVDVPSSDRLPKPLAFYGATDGAGFRFKRCISCRMARWGIKQPIETCGSRRRDFGLWSDRKDRRAVPRGMAGGSMWEVESASAPVEEHHASLLPEISALRSCTILGLVRGGHH